MKVQLTESELIRLLERIVTDSKNTVIYEDIYGSVEDINFLNESEYQ